MNLRHIQYTANPVKDSSLQQKWERDTVCACPTSSKKDTRHTGSDLFDWGKSVSGWNTCSLAKLSTVPACVLCSHLWNNISCCDTGSKSTNNQDVSCCIIDLCLLNIQAIYGYKARHVYYVFCIFTFLTHFFLLLSYKNYRCHKGWNVWMITFM